MSAPIVVICDDEIDFASELAEWFAFQGWAAYTARNATEALTLLGRLSQTSCLITDRLLPMISGDMLVQFVRALPRAKQPELIAVMTGDFTFEDSPPPNGVDLLFFKPVDPGEMFAAIARRLDARLTASSMAVFPHPPAAATYR
jgi:CheY-like chemotaxis protein